MKFAPLLRVTALVTAVALIPVATSGLAAVDAKTGPEFGKLLAVYERIKSNYVEPVEDDKLLKGAIDGMLATLDPHSAFLDARDFENLRTQTEGSYGGLGLSVTLDDGAVKVIAPTKGSPADLAGVKAGDFITHLDGKLIYGGSLDEAVDQMRGVPGTQIKLSVFRPGRDEPFDVTITRKIIELKPVEWELQGNVAVISVSSFSADVGASVKKAWAEAKAKAGGNVSGLVLDLRGNPGGLLDEAIALSDLFLERGTIVSQRGRYARDTEVYPAEIDTKGDIAKGTPMIVLIDEGSASASEIVAGALQDQHRAVVMGQRSFGKGSVQTLIPLTKDTAVKLTTARYYTPSGRSVQEGGIDPDITVPQISDPDLRKRQARSYRESDLRGHLINEIKLEDKDLEKDKIDDPRFKMTAEELKAKNIKDFQLHYAVQALGRTAPRGTLAVKAKR
ncbi:MAG: peptidase S41 [Novosphingobium sp. 28-62-57]|uniref:S41 family peptidase n=1 Tax=unclassified Novosphingobium TaxID=2644732 RepID=UPI000BDD26AF|nr:MULTISPECIES: S41 family peptidase [unclassified Novosphingobium]OYW50184.1 MAG: peptidase S41 [Novosphingobium sp. 12-62-10]OYZ11711.1 MAG: peptidase S41 [Novosphingobium sp. 28-62-57]OZA37225.1 MAG: peptidase S41 [Novosphingobium sp. 17-62-9]HQS69818.1 S41 family peptidase [Novosphingobium sp.]